MTATDHLILAAYLAALALAGGLFLLGCRRRAADCRALAGECRRLARAAGSSADDAHIDADEAWVWAKVARVHLRKVLAAAEAGEALPVRPGSAEGGTAGPEAVGPPRETIPHPYLVKAAADATPADPTPPKAPRDKSDPPAAARPPRGRR